MEKTVALKELLHIIGKECRDTYEQITNKLNTYAANKQGVYFSYKKVALYTDTTRKICLSKLINIEQLEEMKALIDSFEEEVINDYYLQRYIVKVFNCSKDLDTAKKCIPSYLHKYLTSVTFTGSDSADTLHDEQCYSLLEEIPLKNTILGL
jgi:hypothetical protein